ncbi:MAG: tetratricopeptide repeat protein [Pseudomonadota bacterium]
MKKKNLLFALALAMMSSAHAGFEESVKALQARDFKTGIDEARKIADAGDPRGFFLLGVAYHDGLGMPADAVQSYAMFERAAQGGVRAAPGKLAWARMRGDGTDKDLGKALAFARAAVQMQDPEGMFLVYVILHNDALGFTDANGRTNSVKYEQLAARTLLERTLDVEAQDNLYRAAMAGLPSALTLLAANLGGVVGEGNRAKMLALMGKLPGQKMQALQAYEGIARHMEALGPTMATPQVFVDAQKSQTIAAGLLACGTNAAAQTAPAQVVATAISKPLVDSRYLPSKVPGFEQAFLVAGNWEEDWTYTACNNKVVLHISFIADGMGGARFSSKLMGKDIPR